MQARINEQEAQLQARAERIRQLEEIIRTFQRKTFSSSSEQTSAAQMGLFNEAEEIETIAESELTIAPHTRRRRGRPALPSELPREEVIHDLPEADKVCPHDGTALELIGQETSEQLDIIPAQVKVIRHVRLKYACPCCQQHVATATKPAQPLGKSIAAPGLLAYIATAKYVDALPLYRQVTQFGRLGVELDLDFVQALPLSQLRKRHSPIVLGARWRLDVAGSLVALPDPVGASPRQEVHQPRKQGLAVLQDGDLRGTAGQNDRNRRSSRQHPKTRLTF